MAGILYETYMFHILFFTQWEGVQCQSRADFAVTSG